MSFFSPIFKRKLKPVSNRRVLDVETLKLLLNHSLGSNTAHDFRAVWEFGRMATIAARDIEAASRESYVPWARDRWEGGSQARALMHVAQCKAAVEGMAWAVGILHADGQDSPITPSPHVYVWAVISSSVAFFDPSAREWVECPQNIFLSIA